MERLCYRCSSYVEDQTPFCPACGAPQIKVPKREPEGVESRRQDFQAALPPPPPPGKAGASLSPLVHPGLIAWKTFFRIAIPLSAAVGFLTSIQSPLGWLFLLPGGIVATIRYYQLRQPCSLTAWRGAKLGSIIGILSFAFFAIFFAVESAANVTAYRQAMEQLAQEALARYPTPESQQLAQAWFNGPHGVAIITAMVFTSTLLFLLVVSGVTGAMVGAFTRDRRTL